MSSAVVSTSAATGRPFVFADDPDPEADLRAHAGTAAQAGPERSRRDCPVEQSSTESRRGLLQSTIHSPQSKLPPASITPASRLAIAPAPEMAPSGIPALDALVGGLPRGCLTEICGSVSSGRTTVLLAALAAATRRGEYCALIDASDALDPQSATAAGIELNRLLWVRCGEYSPRKERSPRRHNDIEQRNQKTARHEDRLEQVLRATDLLLESGGFGLIVLDFADLPSQMARRIPLTTWFRFRRAIEYKPTMLLAIEQQPIAGSCSSLLLQIAAFHNRHSAFKSNKNFDEGTLASERGPVPQVPPAHTQLFTGLEIKVELIRSRFGRKPAHSVMFETKTAWAG